MSKSSLSKSSLIIPLFLLVSLGACSQKAPGEAAAPEAAAPVPGPTHVAAFQDLMKSEIKPASDALWMVGSSSTDATGTHDYNPKTDADWAKVRDSAVVLAEVANLLVMEGRPVVREGQKLDQEGQEGNLTSAQIAEKFKTDRPLLLTYAKAMQDVSVKALAAIDKKDVAALVDAGGELDAACEACHTHFWYPGQGQPAAAENTQAK